MKITIVPVGMTGTNCYILASEGKGCAIVDPGAQPEKIAGLVEKEGLTPRYILLTHGHYDHIGGVKKLTERFPEARLLIGEKDHEMLLDPEMSFAAHSFHPEDCVIENAETVSDGQELPLDELTVRVMETPGHTKGGVVYLCRDVMLAGDTLFYGSVGRTDFYGGDYAALLNSLRRLAALDGNYHVYPGHGDPTTLEFERRNNPYVRESLQ